MKHILLILILLLGATPALAQPPVPPGKKERLDAYNRRLEAESDRKEQLERDVKSLEGDLNKTRGSLVDLGKSIQDSEGKLKTIEKKIAEKELEKLRIQQDLQKDQQSISRLILALERIKRIPPEALIAKPDAPLKTAQSAMLMSDIIPSLYKQADTLKANLKTLDEISSALKKERDAALEISNKLKSEHQQIAGLMNEREALYARTQADLEEQQKEVRKISSQARNLGDLVRKLDQEGKKRAESEKPSPVKSVMSAVTRAMPGGGGSQLPISGFIKTRYNEPDNFGAPSKGLEIEGVGGALVVTPMNGKVRFAGPFKNYGNIVIVEHDKDYHSLIAGLEKIDTVVGQALSAGEPIGTLHHSSGGGDPVLYYELRLNGEPVNPAKKLKGL